jgi:hypothetical protein
VATAKRIYKGQLPSTPGVLYTSPPGGAGTLIKGIRVKSFASGQESVRIGQGSTNDADIVLAEPVDAGGGARDTDLLVLEPGQTLNGVTTTPGKVTVYISGFEL